jgi:hypothetical protein
MNKIKVNMSHLFESRKILFDKDNYDHYTTLRYLWIGNY